MGSQRKSGQPSPSPGVLQGLLLLVATVIVSTDLTWAATFTVTKTADTNDGICDGDCSLREAIIAANANPGADTIILPAGIYTLTIPGTGEQAAATGDLDITQPVTISGAEIGRASCRERV